MDLRLEQSMRCAIYHNGGGWKSSTEKRVSKSRATSQHLPSCQTHSVPMSVFSQCYRVYNLYYHQTSPLYSRPFPCKVYQSSGSGCNILRRRVSQSQKLETRCRELVGLRRLNLEMAIFTETYPDSRTSRHLRNGRCRNIEAGVRRMRCLKIYRCDEPLHV